ncbi:MAG: amidohydrolase, partial [Flavipsychrobacter sp.]
MRKLLLCLLVPAIGFAQTKIKADLLIQNATIYTADSSWHIYQAIAIKDGSIIALGSNKEINNKYRSDKTINASGKNIYPGFIDAHCHFSGYALDKYKCALEDTRSFQQVIQKLIVYEKTNELSWIYGRGWDQNKWPVKEFPTKDTLDKLFPDKPVILKRIDGHAILCNEKALQMAHIDVHTKIAGGQIIKKNGELTGILIDNAMEPVEQLIPLLPTAQSTKYLVAAQNDCYAFGLTYVIDCGVKKDVINLLKQQYAQNKLSIGNALLLADDEATFNEFVKQGPVSYGQLKIAGIKMYADGALGSRGASLIEDYTDDPGNRG